LCEQQFYWNPLAAFGMPMISALCLSKVFSHINQAYSATDASSTFTIHRVKATFWTSNYFWSSGKLLFAFSPHGFLHAFSAARIPSRCPAIRAKEVSQYDSCPASIFRRADNLRRFHQKPCFLRASWLRVKCV
jgi:hypothetical protein